MISIKKDQRGHLMNIIDKYVPIIIEAAIKGDNKIVKKASIDFLKKLENDEINSHTQLINKLTRIKNLNTSSNQTTTFTRNVHSNSSESLLNPTESDLYSIETVKNVDTTFFSDKNNEEITTFIKSFQKRRILEAAGLKNLNTILLFGKPGVGKTTLAKFIAYKLNMPLMKVNLSQLISRYLGNTGKNISSIIEFAQKNNVVLLFDEFDSIAKDRSRDNDLGEIQRIVSVLLTEIEHWNTNGILISATNFIESIDPAIIRRFSTQINVDLPDQELRKKIWKNYLLKNNLNVSEDTFTFLSKFSKDLSPSAIENISNLAIRDTLVNETDFTENIMSEFLVSISPMLKKDIKLRTAVIKYLKEHELNLSQRRIAKMSGLSKTSVQRIQSLSDGDKIL
ncbi:AAA family ATPase [Leuconostoc mesenteroides]|nr:AAA family ATPase [Leuconostoc mesenteroides]